MTYFFYKKRITPMKIVLSKLLFAEEPRAYSMTLATALGLPEACFIQQLHYWMRKSKNEVNGRKWVYNTYEDWHEQFMCFSVPTIKRLVVRLEKMGLILSMKAPGKVTNMKQYSIDYDKLDKFGETLSDEIGRQASFESDHDDTTNDEEESSRSDKRITVIPSSIQRIPKEKERGNTEAQNASVTSLPKTKKTEFSTDSHEYRIGEYLAKRIREKLDPNFPAPNLQKWAVHSDKMIRLDKRPLPQIKEIINWATEDSFWKKNILSTATLREKYTKLLIAMNEEKHPSGKKGQEVHYEQLPSAGGK